MTIIGVMAFEKPECEKEYVVKSLEKLFSQWKFTKPIFSQGLCCWIIRRHPKKLLNKKVLINLLFNLFRLVRKGETKILMTMILVTEEYKNYEDPVSALTCCGSCY